MIILLAFGPSSQDVSNYVVVCGFSVSASINRTFQYQAYSAKADLAEPSTTAASFLLWNFTNSNMDYFLPAKVRLTSQSETINVISRPDTKNWTIIGTV